MEIWYVLRQGQPWAQLQEGPCQMRSHMLRATVTYVSILTIHSCISTLQRKCLVLALKSKLCYNTNHYLEQRGLCCCGEEKKKWASRETIWRIVNALILLSLILLNL